MKPQAIITIILLVLAGYLLYLVLSPFFIPAFWAAVFAVVLYPYYTWLLAHTGGRKGVAALSACVTIAVFVIVPMAVIGAAIASEVYDLYQWADAYLNAVSTRAHGGPFFLPPYAARLLQQYVDISAAELHDVLANSVKEAAAWMVSGMTGFVRSFAGFVFDALIAFFTMFYIFRDGDRLLDIARRLIPLSDADKDKIIKRAGTVVHATVTGGLLVGVAQGVSGGAAFWALGIKAPTLWGFAMFVLSFLPGIGTALVWGPASVYLLATGSVFEGAALLIWGVFVIGLIDNLLRPLMVGNAANLHPLLIFLSIIGAVNVFGLIGIIAGPLVVSIAEAALEIYQENSHA
ncbi:MAG: AI-2E family transporter [Deltaproteobacteria bacterium]|nr:AI-2E family transporter [Deltaproteobacteria bacterium]